MVVSGLMTKQVLLWILLSSCIPTKTESSKSSLKSSRTSHTRKYSLQARTSTSSFHTKTAYQARRPCLPPLSTTDGLAEPLKLIRSFSTHTDSTSKDAEIMWRNRFLGVLVWGVRFLALRRLGLLRRGLCWPTRRLEGLVLPSSSRHTS